MKPHHAQSSRSSSRWLWLLASCALLLSGCMSNTEVKSIVNASNYEMLLAADPALSVAGLQTDPAAGLNPKVDEAAARIENFLAQHQDDPAMVSALRLRQGLLYLNHGQFSLAENAFAEIKATDLHSARDKTLFAVHAQLRWWNETAAMGPAGFFASEKTKAETAMSALLAQTKIKDVPLPPDLRDYLLEMRAWIGLKLGLATAEATASRAMLQEAINPWAETFSTAELSLLTSANFKDVKPFDLATRRVLRARSLLTTLARQTAATPNTALTFSRPAFQYYYDALPH